MKNAATLVGNLAGLAGLIQIVMGVVFWTGHGLGLIPVHMVIGFVFVLALWTLCVLGMRAGLPLAAVLIPFVWGLIVPALGLAQMQLLPGPSHWVVRLAHLLVGMIAMGQARGLSLRIQGGGAASPTVRPRSPWARPQHQGGARDR